jgi:hypothetical protein
MPEVCPGGERPTLGDVAADLIESFARHIAAHPDKGRALDDVLIRAALHSHRPQRFVDIPLT